MQRGGSAIPQVTTLGALDTFAADDELRPRGWRVGPVEVVPAGPVVLTSEPVGASWQRELRYGATTVTVMRDASGAFHVR
ncbi:hypothetical protein D3C85_1405370 [compost metagenome]